MCTLAHYTILACPSFVKDPMILLNNICLESLYNQALFDFIILSKIIILSCHVIIVFSILSYIEKIDSMLILLQNF